MSRKNPAHPGAIVKSELEELGISVTAAAQALGVTRQQLHRVLNGTHAISPEMAVRLERGLGSTADMWLRLQANYDLAQVAQRADQLKVRALVPA